MPRDYSPNQKKIIRRYYDNAETIGLQRLGELVGELYLSEGKKTDRLWKQVERDLGKVGVAASRIAHLLEKRDPKLLAELLGELATKKP